MQASRLLSIMMLLQSRGRMPAEALAEELEVSVRTIYRDIDQLSAAGVPVYAETGRNGGFELLDGWRTRLTGLTPPEAQALFLAGLPGPAGELGLGPAVASAELKLLAALPADWQAEARRISARFHLDPDGWFHSGSGAALLQQVAGAVFAETRIRVRYDGWKQVTERVIDPLGVVLKGGFWYLVARRGKDLRTYRISSIVALEPTGETFERPADFDLPRYWAGAVERFARDIYVGRARVRATARGVSRLREISETVAHAIDDQVLAHDAAGWAELTVPVETVDWAVRDMTRVGPEVEVLEPPELRSAMVAVARSFAALYAGDTDQTLRTP